MTDPTGSRTTDAGGVEQGGDCLLATSGESFDIVLAVVERFAHGVAEDGVVGVLGEDTEPLVRDVRPARGSGVALYVDDVGAEADVGPAEIGLALPFACPAPPSHAASVSNAPGVAARAQSPRL
jgi:hypothetical protein